MWPMGGRHAAETEAVAVTGQEPANRTARRPALHPQHPNQARRTPAAERRPGRPRRIRLAPGTSEAKAKFRDRSSGR